MGSNCSMPLMIHPPSSELLCIVCPILVTKKNKKIEEQLIQKIGVEGNAKETRFEPTNDRTVKMQGYKEDVKIEISDHDTHAESNSVFENTNKKQNLQDLSQSFTSSGDDHMFLESI